MDKKVQIKFSHIEGFEEKIKSYDKDMKQRLAEMGFLSKNINNLKNELKKLQDKWTDDKNKFLDELEVSLIRKGTLDSAAYVLSIDINKKIITADLLDEDDED